MVLLLAVSAATTAFFTDRVGHSTRFTTASFSADGYKLTRTAPAGPFCAGENVTLTLKESNTGSEDVNSVISMKATWVSPDTGLSIFGNANAADNAKLSIDGTNVSYKVSADKKSITFDLPKHVLAARTTNKARALTLNIPAALRSTGRIDFSFERVTVMQDPTGFSKAFDRTALNAANTLDCRVRVGWAASSISAQNGKALMGYLTEKNASGKFGIEFEFAFGYTSSPMKDFSSKTDAKWSYYKDKADRLTFVEGMTSIGDYAFPDFELITGLTLPESLGSVGKWSFDNISIPSLTLPEALTEFDAMSFGHINELTKITFRQAANTSISFPTAGRTSGAFYVDPYVPTQIMGENPLAQGYDWITDQRRVAPVIRSYTFSKEEGPGGTTMTPETDSNVDFHADSVRSLVKKVVFQDANGYYAIPGMKPADAGGLVGTMDNLWDVSEAQDKSVVAWLKSDGTLIIAGDGPKVKANENSNWLFADMANIATIDAALYDTSNAETLEYWHAFPEPEMDQSGDPIPVPMPERGARQILGIQNWDVRKVTSTKDMFYNSSRLQSLDLGRWDTRSLQTPNGMFHGCSAMTDLDVSGWNTSRVTTLDSTFSHCRALRALDVARWNTSNVTDLSFTFSDCGAAALDLHTWDTGNVIWLENTFSGAGASSINVTGWNTSKMASMYNAFAFTKNLNTMDLSSWDTSSVGRWGVGEDVYMTSAFNSMFYNSDVKSVNVTGFDFANFEGNGGRFSGVFAMFGNCRELKEIIGTNTWTNTDKILRIYRTFEGCEKLDGLQVSNWDTSNVVAMNGTFNGCKSLTALAVDGWNVAKCSDFIETFRDCEKLESINISGWNMESVNSDYFINTFNGCKSLTHLTFPEEIDFLSIGMAANCPNLTTIEFLSTSNSLVTRPNPGKANGALYVSPDAGVEIPVVTDIITHGTGMAKVKDAAIYDLAKDNRTLRTTGINVPSQRGTLTYNGSSQSPEWNNYDPDKMTIGGVTAGINAGTYTATFTPKPGYAWTDGTSTAKNVTWKIGKAPGSLTLSKYTVTLGDGSSSDTFTVTRAGDGAISVTSSNTSVATVSISGTTVTVTKKTDGTATITVKVAEGTNHKAPANKTCAVNCTVIPMLAAGQSWYEGKTSVDKSTITEVVFADSGVPSGTVTASWDASAAQDGGVMAYVVGTKLTLVGNGSGKIYANPNSGTAFFYFPNVTGFTNLTLLDTSKATDMSYMFRNCSYITNLDLSAFDTSNVTNMKGMFGDCIRLTSITGVKDLNTAKVIYMQEMFNNCSMMTSLDLGGWNVAKVQNFQDTFSANTRMVTMDLTGWNTASATNMKNMFCNNKALTTIKGLSGFNTAKVTNMNSMFMSCQALTALDLSNFSTGAVTDMSCMFKDCRKLTAVNVSSFDTANVTNMANLFEECRKLTSLDLTGWNTAKVTNMSYMFDNCNVITEIKGLSGWNTAKVTNMGYLFGYCYKLKTLDLAGWDTSAAAGMSRMFYQCNALQKVTLGKTFQFKSTDGYLPDQNQSGYITGADGKWYDTRDWAGYTPAALAGVTRGDTRTYVVVPPLTVPSQKGTLTYTGSSQTPTWNNYNSAKMTMSGVTSGINAGSYTAVFTPKTGYNWTDGTSTAKNVTWKIGKAAGSLTLSKSSMTLDAGSSTGTFTVTRVGNGAISVSSSNAAVATASVSGTTVTVTKIGGGTAVVTVKVAEGTNHLAPANKTCTVSCTAAPVLAEKRTWYDGKTSVDKSTITEIAFADSGVPSGTVTDSWDASAAQDGSVTAYVVGTKLTLVGNGSGRIYANENSYAAFNAFSSLTAFTGLDKLDTSGIKNMHAMFNSLPEITALDLRSFNTSNVESFRAVFGGNKKLKTLDLTGWDTSKGKDLGEFFYRCAALTTIKGLSGFDTSAATEMDGMFQGCEAMTSLDVSHFNTSKVKKITMMFYMCKKMESIKLGNFDLSNAESFYAMFQYCYKLKALDLSGWNTAGVTGMRSMFGACNELAVLDLSSFDTTSVTNMLYAFDGCHKLKQVTLGKNFRFTDSDSYLPAPSSSYIAGADGNWYEVGGTTGWTPAGVALVNRSGPVTYVAVKGAAPVALAAPVLMVVAAKPAEDAGAAETGAVLESISVTRAPVKTQYVCGELFDKAGMEVTAVYTDGSTKVVEDYMFVDDRPLTADMDSVAISYADNDLIKFCKVAVTVMPDEVDEINGGDGGGGHADPEREGAE